MKMKQKKNLLPVATLTVAALLAGCQPQTPTCTQCTPDVCAHCQTDSAVVVNTIMARRSVRKYKPEPVRRDQMEVILRCGINAPSGMNQQPWAVRVVDNQDFLGGLTDLWLAAEQDPERREKMKGGEGFRNMFRNAPTVVFIASPKDRGQLDCGLLGENMILAAKAMGIGTCCLGGPVAFMKSPAAAEYMQQLQLPEGYELLYAIGMGYPDESPEAKPRDASKVMWIGE